MSLIACISVHQCDHCKRVAVLKDDRQYGWFEEYWYSGWGGTEFCDNCRDLAAVQERIIESERTDRAVTAAMQKYRHDTVKPTVSDRRGQSEVNYEN